MIRTLIFLIGGFAMAAETSTIKLDAKANFKLKNVAAEAVTYKGRKALKVIEANGPGEAMVVLPADFHNGVIEADIAGSVGAGAPEGSRGFVGIAFRVSPDTTKFECFYLRPTNGRAEEQERRNHSVQYVSAPEYPWQRLRKEEPEKYESYVDLIADAWTKVKIVVEGSQAKLYVHGNEQPSLIVRDLKKGDTRGALAFGLAAAQWRISQISG